MKDVKQSVLKALVAVSLLAPSAASAHYTPPDSNLPVERGKAAVGITYLWNVDYVHAGQHCVTGMAYVTVPPGACERHPGYSKPTDFIQNAWLRYRFRHLGLFTTDQYGRDQWYEIPMVTNSAPDMLYTTCEIPIPDVPCDMEYYMTFSSASPYYEYCDYSGLNLENPTGGYSERPPIAFTNRMQRVQTVVLPTGGTDRFIRIRPHRSNIHAMRLSY